MENSAKSQKLAFLMPDVVILRKAEQGGHLDAREKRFDGISSMSLESQEAAPLSENE